MRSRKQTRAGRGFSLIELMVVLGIIALLVALLLPTLAGARRAAQRVTCSSNLRQLGIVFESYTQENDEAYPDARPIPLPFLSISTQPPLYNYLDVWLPLETGPGTNRLYDCPDDDTVYPLAGMSYVYSPSVAGTTLTEVLNRRFIQRIGWGESQIEVASDFDGEAGGTDFELQAGGTVTVPKRHFKRNILFADGHVDIVVR
ncbi:MAG: prepilin-type N-terminal cleavage/methylation domain-containing protein [Planctomycetota bacterium]